MASFVLKGLVINDGIDRLRKGNQRRHYILGYSDTLILIPCNANKYTGIVLNRQCPSKHGRIACKVTMK